VAPVLAQEIPPSTGSSETRSGSSETVPVQENPVLAQAIPLHKIPLHKIR